MIPCKKCGKPMPSERAELGLKACKDCTPQKKIYGFMAYDHKTGGELEITDSIDVLQESKGVSEREVDSL
jgi:hypothetical protein